LPQLRHCGARPTLPLDAKRMKLLYFSSDVAEIQRLSDELLEAGIPCEVRTGPVPKGEPLGSAHAELWIQNERDAHRATMLCVELGAGFAKRTRKRPALGD